MRKSFLLVGVILDIVVITLILFTALNIIHITREVNEFSTKNKAKEYYNKALKALDEVSAYRFESLENVVANYQNEKDYDVQVDYYLIEKDDQNNYTIVLAEDSNTTKKVTVTIKDEKNRAVFSLGRLLFQL